MPISTIDGCSADHWAEVKAVITEAIESINEYEFTVNLVSDSDESGVIQKRIVQNVYSADIVVCDVSGKNPNVMFELGMRLAFDKPTVIIKDDVTEYSFDTSAIEHLEYPRDLRFSKIVKFKQDLAEKIKATAMASKDPNYSTFLKHFGQFKVSGLDQTEVSYNEFVLKELSNIKSLIERPGPSVRMPRNFRYKNGVGPNNYCLKGVGQNDVKAIVEKLN